MAAPTTSLSAGTLNTLAHELRQPLSTIESIAYYLSLVLPPGDEKVHEQLNRIQQLVEQSSWILSSAQQLAEPVRCVREPVDIQDLIAQAVAARFPANEPPRLDLSAIPPVAADPALAAALIDNLVMLFRTLATAAHPLTLRTSMVSSAAAVEMETGVTGYRSEASLCPGSALCLESARRMIAANGGSLTLEVHPESGIRLRLMLP